MISLGGYEAGDPTWLHPGDTEILNEPLFDDNLEPFQFFNQAQPGGIIAKVSKVKDENELEVEIADGTKVRIVRGTVAQVLSKTEPASEG